MYAWKDIILHLCTTEFQYFKDIYNITNTIISKVRIYKIMLIKFATYMMPCPIPSDLLSDSRTESIVIGMSRKCSLNNIWACFAILCAICTKNIKHCGWVLFWIWLTTIRSGVLCSRSMSQFIHCYKLYLYLIGGKGWKGSIKQFNKHPNLNATREVGLRGLGQQIAMAYFPFNDEIVHPYS